MSGLTRTDLATSRKVELAASAVARQDQHGAVTELSDAFGVCRETVYSAREQGRAALGAWFEPREGEVPATVVVDRRQLERAVVALPTSCASTRLSSRRRLP